MSSSRYCLLAASFVCLLLACEASIPDGRYVCDTTADCPPGFSCHEKLCYREPPGDNDGGGVGADAGDAGSARPDAQMDGCAEREFYRDSDMDGFGDSAAAMTACDAPDGYVDNDDDCDDASAERSPDDSEVCDAVDNDCDGMIDEDVIQTFYRDADGDGFGDPTMPMQACNAPDGFVDNDDDCNDECASCRPGGTEVCEGSLDEDCNGTVDNGCTCTIGASRACPGGSMVGVCMPGTQTCEMTAAGAQWGACIGAVRPGPESCNGLDDDCDGSPDGLAAATTCPDTPRSTGKACTGGSCVITACTSGYGNCDRVYSNGCESRFGSVTHCTACGDACGWDCEESGCNDAVMLDGGFGHTCAIREGGDAVCWGRNASGQLGVGDMTDRATPVQVSGLNSGIVSVQASTDHTCALRSTGEVRCWGSNAFGQLGDGSTTSRTTPVGVSGLMSGVSAIATGAYHSCALLATGRVRCWGRNGSGQLGDGTTVQRNAPVEVSLLTGVVAIAAGGDRSCALLSGGAVRCWGSNSSGGVGDGTMFDRSTSVAVSGLSSGVTAITMGSAHGCARLSTGAVRCWGYNANGQIGDGTTSNRLVPTAVSGLASGVVAIAAGGSHNCAVLQGGAVRCWGSNGSGQIGDDTVTNRPTPTLVSQLSSGVAFIAAGANHSCAGLSDGALRCWGNGVHGQIGDGSATNRRIPVAVSAP